VTHGNPPHKELQHEAVQVKDGKTVEVFSTLSENNWQADARAFAANLDVAAAMNQSASGVRLAAGACGIQHVKLYRYK
jgi:hypothetical protein